MSGIMSTGQFLRQYFETAPSGFIELFYLIPEGGQRPRGMRRSYASYAPLPLDRPIPDVIPEVERLNTLGYGVYFGTTPTRQKIEPTQRTNDQGQTYTVQPRRHESDVDYLTAVWCDIDDVTTEDAYERFKALDVEPSLVVRSGGGVHAYWTLTHPVEVTPENKTHIKKVLHAIAIAVGGDVKCRDMARIMRLPGTANTKPGRNNAPCEVLRNDEDRIPFRVIERVFSPFMPRELPVPTRKLVIPDTPSDDLPAVTKKYLSNPPKEGNRNTYLYAAARGCNDAGKSQTEAMGILAVTARSTGLKDDEIEIAIASAYRAPRGIADTTHSLRIAINDRRIQHGR